MKELSKWPRALSDRVAQGVQEHQITFPEKDISKRRGDLRG